MSELYALDIDARAARAAGAAKMPAMPPVDGAGAGLSFYKRARAMFPGLNTRTTISLLHAVAGKYRAKRFELIWTCKSSIPNYRYPTPIPIHNQGWKIHLEDGKPIVSAALSDGERCLFRLRAGKSFHRQIASVKQIVAGDAVPGELALYRQGKDIMCKMVAWLPKQASEIKRADTLIVRTDPDALIVALNLKDDKLWTYHGAQARQWAAEHRKRLQAFADDSKAENRPQPPFARRRALAAAKYRARIADLTHQVSAMIVNYAARRRFGVVRYEDSDTSFLDQFPWYELKAKIQSKCAAANIEFQSAAPAVVVSEVA